MKQKQYIQYMLYIFVYDDIYIDDYQYILSDVFFFHNYKM